MQGVRAFKLDRLQPIKLISFQNIFHLFTQPPIIINLIILGIEEVRKEQGLRIGKGKSSEVNVTKEFMTLGALKLDHLQPFDRIFVQNIQPLYFSLQDHHLTSLLGAK